MSKVIRRVQTFLLTMAVAAGALVMSPSRVVAAEPNTLDPIILAAAERVINAYISAENSGYMDFDSSLVRLVDSNRHITGYGYVDELFYSFYDLNNDSIPELIISFSGTNNLMAYGIADGNPVPLAGGYASVLADGTIHVHETKMGLMIEEYYRLDANNIMNKVDDISTYAYDYTDYLHGRHVDNLTGAELSQEAYEARVSQYPEAVPDEAFNWKPLADFAVPLAPLTTPIADAYRQIITELMQSSEQIPYLILYQLVGFHDLNGDSVSEMVAMRPYNPGGFSEAEIIVYGYESVPVKLLSLTIDIIGQSSLDFRVLYAKDGTLWIKSNRADGYIDEYYTEYTLQNGVFTSGDVYNCVYGYDYDTESEIRIAKYNGNEIAVAEYDSFVDSLLNNIEVEIISNPDERFDEATRKFIPLRGIGLSYSDALEQLDTAVASPSTSNPATQAAPISELNAPNDTPPTISAIPTNTAFMLNDMEVFLPAYLINDSNYVKLRDMGQLLQTRFDVRDEDGRAVFYNYTPYTTTGGELAPLTNDSQIAMPSNTKFVWADSGEMVAGLTAYLINGSSYTNVRDMIQLFGFDIDWRDGKAWLEPDVSPYTPD